MLSQASAFVPSCRPFAPALQPLLSSSSSGRALSALQQTGRGQLSVADPKDEPSTGAAREQAIDLLRSVTQRLELSSDDDALRLLSQMEKYGITERLEALYNQTAGVERGAPATAAAEEEEGTLLTSLSDALGRGLSAPARVRDVLKSELTEFDIRVVVPAFAAASLVVLAFLTSFALLLGSSLSTFFVILKADILGLLADYDTLLTDYPLETKIITTVLFFALGDVIAQLVEQSDRRAQVESATPFMPLPSQYQQADSSNPLLSSWMAESAKAQAEINSKAAAIGRKAKAWGQSVSSLDMERTFRMGAWGFFSGPVGDAWYQWLDGAVSTRLSSYAPVERLFAKVAADQLLWVPIQHAIFLALVTSLEVKRLDFDAIKKAIRLKWTKILLAGYRLWPFVQLLNFYLVPVQYRIILTDVVTIFWASIKSRLTNTQGKTETTPSAENQPADAESSPAAAPTDDAASDTAERTKDTKKGSESPPRKGGVLKQWTEEPSR
ncbi:unnamed protein product [Vitrella brassicaformis CCMP3155]|uniref:Uncharacterized protein n=2 Tax=Vitrella brassicaformis TaxID=1169539 RepID=A0A0G4EXV5_VITBC|nr:unnamed protein product [Vitrella brassicaformis CCMP3155]|eukprot:CEM03235.1 unnamed protein product [Vitrella brassicaformis CCMP3155]